VVGGCTMQVLSAVPALANTGPDCETCGGTLNVIVQTDRERERDKTRHFDI
jgi:hypothetical protein